MRSAEPPASRTLETRDFASNGLPGLGDLEMTLGVNDNETMEERPTAPLTSRCKFTNWPLSVQSAQVMVS